MFIFLSVIGFVALVVFSAFVRYMMQETRQ